MPRIRSVHPGQWTDEAFVQLTPWARLLALAIRNEADDRGVFEWKPLTIKMRAFPADAVDVEALLGEMVEHDHIRRFGCAGRAYGVIRNFRRWQSPKKPNAAHPLPSDLAAYVGLEEGDPFQSSEPVPHQFPTGGEKSRQREEEEEKEVTTAAADVRVREVKQADVPSSADSAAHLQVLAAANAALRANELVDQQRLRPIPLSHGSSVQAVNDWLAAGIPLATVLTVVEQKCLAYRPEARSPQIHSLAYLDGAVREEHERRTADVVPIHAGRSRAARSTTKRIIDEQDYTPTTRFQGFNR